MADLESLEKRIPGLQKKARQNEKEAVLTMELIERSLVALREGQPARTVKIDGEDEEKAFRMLQLLTSKPILYACNVDEDSAADGNELSAKVAEMAAAQGARSVVISAAIESEVALLDSAEDKKEFLEGLGLSETGLTRCIREGYKLLDLLTFFTVGPKEARAWTVYKGATAPNAAGVIHTDFERGFIKAETIAYDDFITFNGEAGARDNGKLRQEGKTYIVKDGDIFHFKFNV